MNVFDYLEWRGDLLFSADKINEVDALIFSWLSYYQLENFRDKNIDIKNLTFEQIRKKHIEIFGNYKERDIPKTIIPSESAEYLFYKASFENRFKNIKVVDFEEVFSVEKTVQFAATTFLIDERQTVVAFRGTDTTIIGWKEDCQLSFKPRITGHELALSYIEKTPKLGKVILCGHSKGGNLALFTLYNINEKELKNIERVYNFDGPGFLDNTLKNNRSLNSKISSFVPESSIVGMLLAHPEEYQVVSSKLVSVLQHNAMLWQIKGTHFVYKGDTSFSSKIVDKTFAHWLNNLSLKEREDFVNIVFSLFEKTNIKHITELSDDFFMNIQDMLKGLKDIKPKQIKMILHISKEFALASSATVISTQKETIKKRHRFLPAIVK